MNHKPRDCATCGETQCDLHRMHASARATVERVTWILDDVWPETASMVAASIGPNDQLVVPGIFGAHPNRYGWPFQARHAAPLATARRHWAMRRVAESAGAVRQQTYLRHDRAVARRLVRAIDYRSRHLVVAQPWLPWIDEMGALGGRTFDVVMSRYPLREIHRLLDEAAIELGPSATIGDFRAEAALVDREARLLDRARYIYTPHCGIAAMFPERAVKLSWHRPKAAMRQPGTRVAFIGPTIARQRPDVALSLTTGLKEPLIIFGSVIEPMWNGAPIEHREMGADWLDGIGAIIHPAVMTHQPRALLKAVASGVAVYATPECGLDPADFRPLQLFSPD